MIVSVCEENGIATLDGVVDLTVEKKNIAAILEAHRRSLPNQELFIERKEAIIEAILRSRYANLFSLLQNHVAEETYLGIVQNKILVDVQGDDVSSDWFLLKLQEELGELSLKPISNFQRDPASIRSLSPIYNFRSRMSVPMCFVMFYFMLLTITSTYRNRFKENGFPGIRKLISRK